MLVFAVETSCDETSVCIMAKNKKIFSHIIYSQEVHERFGGVVPELASRAHLEILQSITKKAFKEASLKTKDIDIFTATCGPGLMGGLLVGSTFAKSLALGSKKPFIPINHLEGHILSTSYNNNIIFPHLVLLITGGHTQIYLLKNFEEIILLGETVDDALGEAFDKVSKLLGLPYPGGKELEKKSEEGNENFYDLPRPMTDKDNYNFSFSGIKTAVNLIIKKNKIDKYFIHNMSASFQKCVTDILLQKLKNVILNLQNKNINISSFSLVGGVANNKYVKSNLSRLKHSHNVDILLPEKQMISDNAAMIAWACIKNYKNKNQDLNFKPNPRLKIND